MLETRFRCFEHVSLLEPFVLSQFLGIPNHDIDLAVDNMSGVQFATDFKEYLEEHSHTVRGMGVIQV